MENKELVTKALEKGIIELGYTLEGIVGFVVNGLTLSDGFDLSNKEDALSIDAILYAGDNYDDEGDYDEDDEMETDDMLSIEEIQEKYNNSQLSEMIAEALTYIDNDASEEIIAYLKSVL